MNNGEITDTVLHWAEQALGDVGEAGFAIVMFLLFLPLSFLIPSSSGLATVAMPIMAPLAAFADVPAELVVTAYQSASGIMNLFIPTSAVVMGGLPSPGCRTAPTCEWVWPLLAMLVGAQRGRAGRGSAGRLSEPTHRGWRPRHPSPNAHAGTRDPTDDAGDAAMTTFTVWKFEDPEGAAHAERVLKDAQDDGLVKIVDHAVMTWPPGADKPETHHKHDDSKRGAAWGALWGILGGALFAIPVAGAVAGVAIGALAKSTEGTGITKEDLARIRTEVVEGTSALFLVTEDADLDKLGERFRASTRR